MQQKGPRKTFTSNTNIRADYNATGGYDFVTAMPSLAYTGLHSTNKEMLLLRLNG